MSMRSGPPVLCRVQRQYRLPTRIPSTCSRVRKRYWQACVPRLASTFARPSGKIPTLCVTPAATSSPVVTVSTRRPQRAHTLVCIRKGTIRICIRFFPAERQYLYVAMRHGDILSFLWLVGAGRHAVEFYGGVSDAGQEWKSNYLLKWHAIRDMKAAGYQVYDLNGRVNEGIAQFKQGFGPVETSWIGPFDDIYHPVLYSAWTHGLPLARRLAKRAG